MVTVLLKVGKAEYDLVSGSVAFPEPSQLSAGEFFALARSQPPFEDFLKGDWSRGWNILFVGLSEEQANRPGAPRVAITGAETLSSVASEQSRGAELATIWRQPDSLGGLSEDLDGGEEYFAEPRGCRDC
jgi:hypothetical protein